MLILTTDIEGDEIIFRRDMIEKVIPGMPRDKNINNDWVMKKSIHTVIMNDNQQMLFLNETGWNQIKQACVNYKD